MSFNEECESCMYGVDYAGKVWVLRNETGENSCWALLNNPSNLNIKRIVSFQNVLWGLGSDHQIYVYVPKGDIPIRVKEVIYENQRWNPLDGFSSKLLPTDRSYYSDETGVIPKSKDVLLPSGAWEWEGQWQIETMFENQIVHEGWTYAIDFPATYHATKSLKSFVRRRKLFRYRRYALTDRWSRIEPLFPKDPSKEPFIDVSVAGLKPNLNPETCCLWGVSVLGEVYFRTEASFHNPEGTSWQNVSIRKGLEANQISVAKNGTPFVVTWSGSLIYRIGITPKTPMGTDWLETSGPPGGLLQIAAGVNCLWAITRDKKCWSLKGKWPDVIACSEPEFQWVEIPGKVKSVYVGRVDTVVLALSDDEVSTLMLRVGISEDQCHGQSWKSIFTEATWDSLSLISNVSADEVDTDSDTSCVSLQPDLPSHNLTTQPVLSSPNYLCWVDGNCLSNVRNSTIPELEIGPWREEIVQDLYQLALKGKQYEYPSAIETTSSSWSSKSSKVRFRNMTRSKKWLEGQLEISNNDHIVFHENMERSWLCSVNDVLSIFGGIDGTNLVTCRIRNSIEPGVADIVQFKFSGDHEAEDWREALCELCTNAFEQYSVANLWMVTSAGELHNAGLLKMLDAPVASEVVNVEPGQDLKLHHPLVNGFLTGSEVVVDLTVKKGATKFTINLQGNDDVVVFHFNPRFTDRVVVRNAFAGNKWGVEESDGDFPFRENISYEIRLNCTPTHILVTIIESKRQYIFEFKHRIPTKHITSLAVRGDVNVGAVRYDPKSPEDVFELEFVTNVVPGHFWKVEAGPENCVWALGYDQKVWCYLGRTKKDSGNVAVQLNKVTDDKVFYIYENQRWNPIHGFSSFSLPTDRHNWTDETGRLPLDKDNLKLPSQKWSWISDWEIDYDPPGGTDDNGWQYAVDFPASYHSSKRINDFVRRRRWKRICRFLVSGSWQMVPNMRLVDLSIRMNENCDIEVIGLQENGEAVVRSGVTMECKCGVSWDAIVTSRPMVSISGWYNHRVWAIGKDGFAYIRYGNNWQLLDRPSGSPLKYIRVGPSSVWAISINNSLYRRSEIQPIFPEGKEWVKVCDNVIQISLSPDGSLWGLLKTSDIFKCTLARRVGISQNAPSGLGWELLASGPWRHCSASGVFSRNR